MPMNKAPRTARISVMPRGPVASSPVKPLIERGATSEMMPTPIVPAAQMSLRISRLSMPGSSGALAVPEAAPVAAAGAQRDQGIQRSGPEAQAHHQDDPEDGRQPGPLAEY